MTVHMRQATAQDLPQVLQLYAQPAMDNGQVLSLEAAEQHFAQFSHYPSYRLFVACAARQADPMRDDPVVGTYALLVMHNLAHQGTPSAIVEDVVVSAEHQSQGVGRAMMAHAMRLAREPVATSWCCPLTKSANVPMLFTSRWVFSVTA